MARLDLVLLERSTDGLKSDLAIRPREVLNSQAFQAQGLEAAIDTVEQLGIVEEQTQAESLELRVGGGVGRWRRHGKCRRSRGAHGDPAP